MRILAAISHHGLGHLAQAAPILNVLHEHDPGSGWLIWSGLSAGALAARLRMPFAHRDEAADVGLAMHDALRVDRAASAAAYRAFHGDWDARVEREARWLREQEVAAVLSDVAYLPLAAAHRAGIPALAFCSLNWVDIAASYLADEPEMPGILAQMGAAYGAARAFLRLAPAMPMAWLERHEEMPPVALTGQDRRAELRGRLGLSPDDRVVLLGFGGIAYRGGAGLPRLPGVTWLVPDDWEGEARADMVGFSRVGIPFLDQLASCDALITKSGYGSFVEAVAHGVPVLYLDRPDWPESPYLAAWLTRHGRARAISEAELLSPDVRSHLLALWERPAPRADAPGAQAVAARIRQLLA